MKPATAEWVTKAEGDFLTAGREVRARKSPNYDAVCFHAQQCAEKYLKAVLQENERNIPKIHNLIELMLLCEEMDNSFEMLRADLVTMERFQSVLGTLARPLKKEMLNLLTPRLARHENLSGRN